MSNKLSADKDERLEGSLQRQLVQTAREDDWLHAIEPSIWCGASGVAQHVRIRGCGASRVAQKVGIHATYPPLRKFDPKTSCSNRLRLKRSPVREPVRLLLPRSRLRRLQPRAVETLPPRARPILPAS